MRRAVVLSSICACLSLTAAAWADVPPAQPCTSTSKAGDTCNDVSNSGVCVEVGGALQCRTSCATAGSACCGTSIGCCTVSPSSQTGSGVCIDEGGGKFCAPQDEPCTSKKAGDACTLENGSNGTCTQSSICDLGSPTLLCEPTNGVSGSTGQSGSCASAPAGATGAWAAVVAALGAALVALRRRRAA